MKKHYQAINCFNEAVRVYEIFQNEVEDKLAEVLEAKGDNLYQMNDYETALSVFQECIDLLDLHANEDEDEDSGSHHVYDERAAKINCKIGTAFAKLGNYEDAFNSYREAVNIFNHVSGEDSLHVGDIMYDIGLLIINKGGGNASERKAVGCFNEMIRIYDLRGEGKDTKVADALVQKSSILADCHEYEDASTVLDEAIAMYKEIAGDDSIGLGKAMLLSGRIYAEQEDKVDESMAAFDEALRIFQILSGGEDDINVYLALSNIGKIHARKLEYAEAIEKSKLALKIRLKCGEQDKGDVADSFYNIGNILNDWKREDEACQYFEQALKLYSSLHGDEHMSVAKCHQKLGAIYWKRKDIGRATDSFCHALQICEQQQDGNNDVIILLTSIHKGLGDCYYSTEKHDLALENFAKCIRLQKMELGDECIEMAAPCNYIGLIYQKREKYDEAMNFHAKALSINETHHGKGSKECATSDFHIIDVLLNSLQYEECITHLRNHLEMYCDESRVDDDLAKVYHHLGLAQGKIGEYEQSITSLNKALSMWTNLFGKTNLKVAETMIDLGQVMKECGDSEEAIAIYDQAITIFKDLPDANNHSIASAYSQIGVLFEEQGNNEASLHSRKKALKIYSTNLGSDSIEVGELLYHIGKIYDHLGNYDKSMSCLSEAVKILRSKSMENEMVGRALGYIGNNYARNKQYAKAVELSSEALRLLKKFAEAGAIVECLVDMGTILKAWGKKEQAVQVFLEALQTYEEIAGLDAIEVAACRYNIGLLHKQLGESESALRHFGESLRVYRLNEGESSLNVANSLFQIGRIYDSFGKKDKSKEIFGKCIEIRESILGDDHIDVLAARRCFHASR